MLKRYEVKPASNGGEWAVIVIDTERGFFATVSDRGNYAHLWTDTGEGDFRSFLIGLESSPDYLHGKLMTGRKDRKVYDGDATEKAVRAAIDALPPEEKRRELRVLEEADFSSEAGVVLWEQDTRFEYDIGELVVRVPEPDCLAFCTGIFPRFVAMLREELRAEREAAEAAAKEVWGVWAIPSSGHGADWVHHWVHHDEKRWVGTREQAVDKARQGNSIRPIDGPVWAYEARRILTDAEKHELAAGVEIR